MTTSIANMEPIYSDSAADPMLNELVELYVAEVPDRIAALETAFSSGDRESLRRAAHQMRGAAGSYGFESLTAAAGILETAVVENQPAEAVRLAFDDLVRLSSRIRAGLPQ